MAMAIVVIMTIGIGIISLLVLAAVGVWITREQLHGGCRMSRT